MLQFEVLPNLSRARRPADYVLARAAVTTHEEMTVPDGANLVVLSGALPFHVAFGDNPSAAVPADTTDGTANELINPNSPLAARTFICVPGQKISVAAASSTMVTASFYS